MLRTIKRHFDLTVYYRVMQDAVRKLSQLILSNYPPSRRLILEMIWHFKPAPC